MKKMVLAAAFATALMGMAAQKALAQTDGSPTDFVRGLYESDPIYNPGFDEPFDARLTGPALAAVEKNARESAASGEIACIDFVLSVNAQDWDDATVRRTLDVAEAPGAEPEATKVTATFKSFIFEGIPEDQQDATTIEYDLRKVDGAWKIADIAGKSSTEGSFGWRLSELCR